MYTTYVCTVCTEYTVHTAHIVHTYISFCYVSTKYISLLIPQRTVQKFKSIEKEVSMRMFADILPKQGRALDHIL